MPFNLTDWAVHPATDNDGYKAPEQMGVRLSGLCPARAAQVGRSGDLTHRVYTSVVEYYDEDTRTATTFSGTEYVLVGPPNATYAAWCRENGYDPTRVTARR